MKNSLSLSAMFLVAMLIIAGCGRPEGPPDESSAVAVPVEVLQVALGDVTVAVSATGTVEAREDIPMSAEASGQVEDVLVRVGDRVQAGEVLIRLDSELAALAVRQAEAQLLLAEADLDNAEAGLARAQNLWESKDISDAEFEASERLAKIARAGFMAAEAQLGSARRQLRNTEIASPTDGVVAFVYAEQGHLVALGAPVARIVDDREVQIEIGLTQDQVLDVRPGRRAEVRVRSLSGEVFEGTVEYVGPRADDLTKTYPARIVLANRDRKMLAGMVAEVTIEADELTDVVAIDRDWVVERYGEPAVFVVSDSLAVLSKVGLGRVVGDRVVVNSGLKPGDQIVTLGYDQLTENARVDVKNVR